MKLNPQIFREYDIRGAAGSDFDEAFSNVLGRAFGTMILERGISRAVVGRDCRISSPAHAEALRDGLMATGVDVVDAGVCPTPLLYYAVHHLDLQAGVEVTGSHNPPDHNGFKMVVGRATIWGDDIRELARRIEKPQFRSGSGRTEAFPVIPAYQGFLAEHFGRAAAGLKVVVDSGNGTAGPVAPRVYRRMGCDVIDLFSEPDGTFPNHHPDPTVEENLADLIAKVRESRADLGLAFDGDADRIGVVDGEGRVIWGDELLVIFARDILERQPGATIVSEVKCSQRLYDDIEARGGRAIMWKAGHSLLKAKMRETGALLGGEMSGHLFFADRWFGFDDGIYAGARLLEIIARTGRSVSDLLADLPRTVYTPEIRVSCPDEIKFRVAEEAQRRFRELGHETIDVDGVRVVFERGWGLIRASNTQPVLVLRFEATDEVSLARYRRLVEGELDSIRERVVHG